MTEKTRAVVRSGVALSLSLTLALSAVPTHAFAADTAAQTQTELDSARARLDELQGQCATAFSQLEDAQASLEDTRAAMSETQSQIDAKEQELGVARGTLSQTMAANYKSGVDFLSFVLGSNDFQDLVSRVYYANKVSASQTDAINVVRTIQGELQGQKDRLQEEESQQEELLSQSEQSFSQIQSLQSQQQEYVNGLSEEVQRQLAAEREAAEKAAAEKAAAEAAARAAQDAQQGESGGQSDAQAGGQTGADGQSGESNQGEAQGQGDANHDSNAGSGQEAGTGSDSGSSSGSSSNSSSNSAPAPAPQVDESYGSGISAVISAARSQLGVSYSWAGNAIANQEFDCSGIVWWAYRQAGYSIPRGQRMSNGYNNSMIGWVLQRGGFTTNQANLKAGDLMFWGGGTGSTIHVGLCIGNGQMIHSNYGGVEVTSVYYSAGSFVGGGPIV
nr:NlpC/P60 family protein [uncultured Olsenella sp.]